MTYQDRLEWTLGHPDADRAALAARLLGRIGDLSVAPVLERVVEESNDPYLAAEALRSLLRLLGVRGCGSKLEAWARHGPLLVRRVAQGALDSARASPGGPGP